MDNKKLSLLSAAILAFAIIVLGLCLKSGIDNFTDKDHVVTVKGLSEMEIPANKVTWPIVTKVVGNDLQQLYAQINSNTTTVRAFLKSNGITDDEISVNAPVTNDRTANDYSSNDVTARYNISSVITVTSSKVDKVRAIMARQGELLAKGVAVVSGGYDESQKVTYEYTKFRDIKPRMMNEAIENARTTAEQFASKGDMKLGRIVKADQGQFSIENRDSNTPYVKRLRVVTTITYQLK